MADLDAVEFGADGREEERGRRRERTETGLDANSIDASASWVAQFNSNETSTDTLRLRGGARGSPPPPGSPGTGIRQLRSGSRASSRGSPSPGPSSPAAKRPGSGAIVVQKTAKDANLENVGKVALTPMVEAVDLSELISRSAKKAYEELASMSETSPGSHLRRLGLLSFASSHMTTFSRLLVLVRYMRATPDLPLLTSMASWIELQNDYWTKAADGLYYVANDPSILRESNWDIERAIDVLRGNIRGRLPTILWERFGIRPPGLPGSATDAATRLKDIVARRLGPTSKEVVPPALSRSVVSVEDYGIAKLHAEGRWSCVLSLLPNEEGELRWKVHRIDILVGNKNSDVVGKAALRPLSPANLVEDGYEDAMMPDIAPVRDDRAAFVKPVPLLTPAQRDALLIPAQAALESPKPLESFYRFLEDTAAEVLLGLVAIECGKLRKEHGLADVEVDEADDGSSVKLKFWTNAMAVTYPEPPAGTRFAAADLHVLDQPQQPSFFLSFVSGNTSTTSSEMDSTSELPDGADLPPLDALGLSTSDFVPELVKALSSPEDSGASPLTFRAYYTLPGTLGTSAPQKDIVVSSQLVSRLLDPANPQIFDLLKLVGLEYGREKMARIASLLREDGLEIEEATEDVGKIVGSTFPSPTIAVPYGKGRKVRISWDFRSGRVALAPVAQDSDVSEEGLASLVDDSVLRKAEEEINARLENVAEQMRSLRFASSLQTFGKWCKEAGMFSGRSLAEVGLTVEVIQPLFSTMPGFELAPACTPLVFQYSNFPHWYFLIAVAASSSAPNDSRLRIWLLGTAPPVSASADAVILSADEWHESEWSDAASGGPLATKRKRSDSDEAMLTGGEQPLAGEDENGLEAMDSGRSSKRRRTGDPDEMLGLEGIGADLFQRARVTGGLYGLVGSWAPNFQRLWVPQASAQRLLDLGRRLLVYRIVELDLLNIGLPCRPISVDRDLVFDPFGRNTRLDPRVSVLLLEPHYFTSTLFIDMSNRIDDFGSMLENATRWGPCMDAVIKVLVDEDNVKLPKVATRFRLRTEGWCPVVVTEKKDSNMALTFDAATSTVTIIQPGQPGVGKEIVKLIRGTHILGFLARQMYVERSRLDRIGVRVSKWALDSLTIKYSNKYSVTIRWSEAPVVTVGTLAANGSFTLEFTSEGAAFNPHQPFADVYTQELTSRWNIVTLAEELHVTADYFGGVYALSTQQNLLGVPSVLLASDGMDPLGETFNVYHYSPRLTRLQHRSRGFVIDIAELEPSQLRTVAIMDAASQPIDWNRETAVFRHGGPVPRLEATSRIPFYQRFKKEASDLVDDRTFMSDFEAADVEPDDRVVGAKVILAIPTPTALAVSMVMAPKILWLLKGAMVALEVLDWLDRVVNDDHLRMAEVKTDRQTLSISFTTAPYVAAHQPLRVSFRFNWRTATWICAFEVVKPMEQPMQTRRSTPSAMSPGTPGNAQDPRYMPFILPGLKGDANNPREIPDPRNTNRELEKMARWFTAKLSQLGDSGDPRPVFYSILQVASAPPQVVSDICQLIELEQNPPQQRVTSVHLLLTVPKTVANEDAPLGAPGIRVDRESGRVQLVLRFSDVGLAQQQRAQAGARGAAVSPNTSALGAPSSQRGAANTPSPQPGTGTPKPQQPSPRPAQPSARMPVPGQLDVIYLYNFKSFFQTVWAPRERPESSFVPMSEYSDSNRVLKQFGELPKSNPVYGFLATRSMAGNAAESEKRVAGVVSKLIVEKPVTGQLDRYLGFVGAGEGGSGGPGRGGGFAGRGRGGMPPQRGKPASPANMGAMPTPPM